MVGRGRFAITRRRVLGLVQVLGFASVVMGLVYSGSDQNVVVTALIFFGAFALILPSDAQIERFALGGIEISIPHPLVDPDDSRFQRFATLMCGDPDVACRRRKEVLARVRGRPRADRGASQLRALVELLDTDQERGWLWRHRDSGAQRKDEASDSADLDPTVGRALLNLAPHARAAFILRFDWSLSTEEVAAALGRPVEDVRRDILRARAQVKYHIHESKSENG